MTDQSDPAMEAAREPKSLVEQFTSTPDGMRTWRGERLVLDVTEEICRLLDQAGVTRAELAVWLGKTKSRVTRLLDGEGNLTLRTISDMLSALGYQMRVYVEPVSAENSPGLQSLLAANAQEIAELRAEVERLKAPAKPPEDSRLVRIAVAIVGEMIRVRLVGSYDGEDAAMQWVMRELPRTTHNGGIVHAWIPPLAPPTVVQGQVVEQPKTNTEIKA